MLILDQLVDYMGIKICVMIGQRIDLIMQELILLICSQVILMVPKLLRILKMPKKKD